MGDSLHPGPPLRHAALIGLAFLFGGATVAGVPPFSGFLGKLMVLQSTRDGMAVAAVWSVILVTSVLTLIGCSRAGSILLWNVTEPQSSGQKQPPRAGEWMALAALVGCSLLLVVFAAPITRYTDETAAQLIAPSAYIDAVLGPPRDDLIRSYTGAVR
jgi:multicomponent K+:H+ antiporter subunit D